MSANMSLLVRNIELYCCFSLKLDNVSNVSTTCIADVAFNEMLLNFVFMSVVSSNCRH